LPKHYRWPPVLLTFKFSSPTS